MPQVDISIGELIDKISILEIKSTKIEDKKKLTNVEKELKLLKDIAPEIDDKYHTELSIVNIRLWEVEDELRVKESKEEFDDEFIALARSVYKLNDERARIKYRINIKYNSELVEEKSYA